jgi:hypothetical protein
MNKLLFTMAVALVIASWPASAAEAPAPWWSLAGTSLNVMCRSSLGVVFKENNGDTISTPAALYEQKQLDNLNPRIIDNGGDEVEVEYDFPSYYGTKRSTETFYRTFEACHKAAKAEVAQEFKRLSDKAAATRALDKYR